jgi:hypothetical protein
MNFSKWRPEMLHEIEYLVFHNYFVFFGKKKCFSSEIHVFRSNQFSLLMYRCLLPLSATSIFSVADNGSKQRYINNEN